jgi:SAM-dependent methyltransferase
MNDTSALSTADLRERVLLRHDGDPARYGWATRMRLDFDYFTPDEVYEALVDRLVTPGCAWLDVGCGRAVFPSNERLARALAARSALLVGVDPDETIEENAIVHRRFRGTVEGLEGERTFDVVTLRMVAEHVTDPEATAGALARLTGAGGVVVVYTVNRWSPASVVSRVVPFGLHHPVKRWLWGTEEKDTFPVAYRMNTRGSLRRLFEHHGFREANFAYLDDCRSLGRFKPLLFLELSAWRALRAVGLRYPENCLLGVYEKLGPAGGGREDPAGPAAPTPGRGDTRLHPER